MSTLPNNPDPYNTPNVDVSPLSVKSYFPKGPMIGTWLEPWFGYSHLDVGYKSDDPAAVASQIATIKARGYDFVLLNSYGTDVQPQARAMLLLKAECEKQGLPFAIALDKGTWTFGMPKGGDPTAYGIQQMAFIAKTFFSSPMYMKHTDGRFLFLNWDCASVPSINAAKVFGSVPNVATLYEHSGGVSQPNSAGCYPWVGLPDPAAYQSSYFSAALKSKAANPKQITFAAVVKGFDDHGRHGNLDPTKSCWNQNAPYRFVDELQGQFFLDRIAALNAFMSQHPGVIDYIFTPTHNDYEENTTVSERGIDSQLTVTLSAAGGVLTAALNGNLNTVDHIEFQVFDGTNHNTFSVSADAPTFDLNSLKPSDVQVYSCSAVVVGKPLFQTKTSNTITTTATVIPYQTKQVNVPVHIDTSFSVPVSGTASGLTVSGSVSVPVQQDSTVSVLATVSTQTIWE